VTPNGDPSATFGIFTGRSQRIEVSNELARPAAGLTARTPGTVAVPGAGAPVHTAGELSFRSAPTPDEAWAMVPVTIRDRLVDRCGQVLERWAWTTRAGEPCAVVLGSRALAVANPARGGTGRAAHRIETVTLRPETARVAAVHEDTAGRTTAAGAAGAGPQAILPNNTMAGFLGNLPARAQQLLQEPFAATLKPLRGDHFYLRTRGAGGLGRTELEVFCYLFDQQWMTCVSGSGVTYGQSFDAARWDLTCRRIAVRPR
jgi:hypothetical protein